MCHVRIGSERLLKDSSHLDFATKNSTLSPYMVYICINYPNTTSAMDNVFNLINHILMDINM